MLFAGADFRVYSHCVGYSRFFSAGADFRVYTRCVGYSRFYLLGQIFVFIHAVLAIAGVICWGRFSCLYTLCWL